MTSLPLWLRWVLSLLVFAALGGGLVAALRGSGDSSQNHDAAALLRANREARVVVLRDQAPRSSALARGVEPRQALQVAIAADVRNRVRRGQLGGPVQGVRCVPSTAPHAAQTAFRCLARAAGFGYPFFSRSPICEPNV